VDPREHDEAMRGAPLSRATSPDGRWAYTLYDGAGGAPFVHALDTSKRRARCIDLPMLAGRQDLSQLRLTATSRGAGLEIGTAGRPLALVDARTFRVTVPIEPVAGTPARRHGNPVLLLAGAVALAAILAAILWLHIPTPGRPPACRASRARPPERGRARSEGPRGVAKRIT